MATNTNHEQNIDNVVDQLLAKLAEADFDLYAFMDLTVKEVIKLTPATGSVVEIVEGDEMVYRAVCGVMEEYLGMRLAKTGSISGKCVEAREVLYSEDTELDDRVDLQACRKVGARSLVVAPLFHLTNAVGVLKIISNKPNAFSERDINILKRIAGCLGNALAMQIYQEIRKSY